MACGIATLKMSSDAVNVRDRREISSAIVKTFALTNEVPQYLDSQTNPKEMHPVDLLARVVETEGMRQLLTMTKKKDLQKMCEFAGLVVDMNDKRQVIKIILQTWTKVGTKKFLKKNVSDTHLATICKNLGIPASASRPECVERIIRQLNIIGLENLSKKVTDENVKNILEQTSKGQQSEKNLLEQTSKSEKHLRTSQKTNGTGESRHQNGERHSGENRHANGESRLQLPLEKSGMSSSSRSSSREHGMAKSQEMKQKTPRSKGKDKDSKSPRKEKEKDKGKKKS